MFSTNSDARSTSSKFGPAQNGRPNAAGMCQESYILTTPRNNREMTIDSQASTSTLEAEHVQVSEQSSPSGSVQSASAPREVLGDEYWICCGGRVPAFCPDKGTYLLALYDSCVYDDCQHRVCSRCERFYLHESNNGVSVL